MRPGQRYPVHVLTTTASMSLGADARVAHRHDSRLGRQRRRMRRKPAVQRIGIDCEDFRQRIERQAARGNPVVAEQDGLG